MEGYACGLDLGTTFSCIGVFKNGGVEIIPNRNGDKITPSIVTVIDENKILKGEETMEYLVKNYDSSIYAIKRFIGRDFNDKNLKDEINYENFPFIIKENSSTKHIVVEVNKNGKKLQFNLEEISSFVIRKMVDNAEEYLKSKINKLVITVPANFKDQQRNCTKQAAELAGLEVLRIINEPTAAALAYGLQENDNKNNNGNILVFDLGGGTFDVTILKIIKSNDTNSEKLFDVLSTSGDKFLGGEDFDNELVKFVLKDFCENNEEIIEQITKDKKAIKRLKIACENIKKVLSYSDETLLCINHFYNNKDIYRKITRVEFEFLCGKLFNRLSAPLEKALNDARLIPKEINEIVLVGGSTRIPKIKHILNEKFPGCHINDTINPDETVAYGATLMAAKIMLNNSFTSKFNLMDITPFSLGTNVKNNSTDPNVQKEGSLMSVIIKRGTKIPINNTEDYYTVEDNQKTVAIDIYEGEKKYVKYNHILKKTKLEGLTPRPAGQVKIKVNFFVDVNGILTVNGTEEDPEGKKNNQIKVIIKNDGIGLTKEEIEEIKKRNEKFIKNRIKEPTDYYNIKETLKEYQDAYNETKEEEGKFNILMASNSFLEEFINKFDKNFDNETMLEKFYIYVKELFISYNKIFSLKNNIDKGDQIKIVKNIEEYIIFFINLNSGYLDDLLEVLKNIPKKIFIEIIVFIMEKLNECGINCLKKRKKFSRYNSMIYFEKSVYLFKKYIVDNTKLFASGCDIKTQKICKDQYKKSEDYIKDINSKIILLCEDALREKKLISSKSGWTIWDKIMNVKANEQNEKEKYQIALETYEKMLPEYQGKANLEEAIILANIIKINCKLLGYTNYKLYLEWADRCQYIADNLRQELKTEWYTEFSKIYKELKEKKDLNSITDEEMKKKIRKKYHNKFEEIDTKFTKRESNAEFINYVVKNIPYKEYDKDSEENLKDFNNVNQDLLFYLKNQYHPNEYSYTTGDEKSELSYCLIEHVDSYLNQLYEKIN